MDNFDDFTNVAKGPSKLASLFGLNKSSNADNPSLTYTAPKQPKEEGSPLKPTYQGGHSGVTLKIIISKTVRAYKLVDGVYQDFGKMGLTLLGCKAPPLYQLLLYKTRNDVLCKVRVLQSFIFSVHINNYASFYSETQQNFSVMFDSSSDLREFARQLTICKSKAEPLTSTITQDLSFGDSLSSADVTNIEVKYRYFQLAADDTQVLVEENQKTLSDNEGSPWVKALSAMRVGAEKIVILPGSMSELRNEVTGNDMKVMIEVTRVAASAAESNRSFETVEESAVESSNEESSIKERGCVLKDALSARSQKASLLSRMARMGQATLPLRGAIAADPSDSEEDSSPSPKPRTRLKPVPVSETVSPAREPAVRWSQHSTQPLSQPLLTPSAQPVSLYQPPVQSQFFVQRGDVPGYASLVSTTPSALPSPTDASLSAHFSESRTQAAELRMGLGKVADKVDLVLNKINDLHTARQPISQTGIVDPTSILTSIQALVSENEGLRSKVEDQSKKLDAQNERIYHLLELSHKTIENRSLSSQQQTDAGSKIAAELQGSREKEKALSENIVEATNRISILEKQVQEFKELSETSTRENELLKSKLCLLEEEKAKVDKRLEETTDRILRAEDLVKKVEVGTTVGEEERKINLKVHQELIELQEKLQSYENVASEMRAELEQLQISKKRQLELLEAKAVEIKEQEAELVELRQAIKDHQTGNNFEVDDVKDLMNLLYRTFLAEFELSEQYSGSRIKQTLASVIRGMTLKFLSRDIESEDLLPPTQAKLTEPLIRQHEVMVDSRKDESAAPSVVTALASENKTAMSSVTPPEDNNVGVAVSPTSPNVDKNGEQGCVDGAIAMETQGLLVKEVQWKEEDFQVWRSTQPPPPPLFDEDEDNDSDWA